MHSKNLIMEIRLKQIPVQIDLEIPFEFKEINPSDFLGYEVEEKIIIEPDGNGFIYNSLNEVFDFDTNNTLVINAAVGQGKSFAVNKFAKEYYVGQGNYKVFIVVPFISLIAQYYNKLLELEIPENEIIDYQKLKEYEDKNSPTFHLITINSLLGNFGENAISQSEIKKEYLNGLVSYCKANHFKAVFFIDEVHDSSKNFKELFVLNL
jgi:superfamily II DNA or RNA helicase